MLAPAACQSTQQPRAGRLKLVLLIAVLLALISTCKVLKLPATALDRECCCHLGQGILST